MSDRGSDPSGAADGADKSADKGADKGADRNADTGADSRSDGAQRFRSDDLPADAIDELEPASDLDDVAFGLDLNSDDVDLTFDPNWVPSVAGRSWGDPAAEPRFAGWGN